MLFGGDKFGESSEVEFLFVGGVMKGMFLLTSSVEVEAYFWWVLVELDQVSMKSISQRVTAFDKAQCKYKQHMCKGFLM